MKYEYRITPLSDFYVVECRAIYGHYKGSWSRCEPLGFFGKWSHYADSERQARKIVEKHKKQQEKWERDYERRKAIERSRKVIYIE